LIAVLGGSTNAVLHFLAIAKAAEIDLTIDDFQKISDSTPFLELISRKFQIKDMTGKILLVMYPNLFFYWMIVLKIILQCILK